MQNTPALGKLAAKINSQSRLCGMHGQRQHAEALNMGKVLAKAKAVVPPRMWSAWLKANTMLTNGDAGRLIRTARLFGKIV